MTLMRGDGDRRFCGAWWAGFVVVLLSGNTRADVLERADAGGSEADREPASSADHAEVVPDPSPRPFPADLGYFKRQSARPFVSAELGAGIPVHGVLAAGYGRPHYLWGGVDGNVLLTPWFFGTTAGLRLRLLIVNWGFNVRRVVAFGRTFAARSDAYADADLADPGQGRSEYTSLNMQVGGFIPVGPTLGVWEIRGNYLLDLPPDTGYYNEIFRAVLNDEGALLAQVHWLTLLLQDRLRVGPGANVVLSRSRSATVRLGVAMIWSLTNHLTLDLIGSLPAVSPDPDLAFGTQFWGLARVKWVWATEEPAPGFF